MERIFTIECIQSYWRSYTSFGSATPSELFAKIFSVRRKTINHQCMPIHCKNVLIFVCLFLFRKGTETTYQQALMYAGGIVLLNSMSALVMNHFQNLALRNALYVNMFEISLKKINILDLCSFNYIG